MIQRLPLGALLEMTVQWITNIYMKNIRQVSVYTMALMCHFPFSIFLLLFRIFWLPFSNFLLPFIICFTSLHHLFYFFRVFLYFSSPFFALPFTIFFYFPVEFFLLHFSFFKLILLSVSIFTSLQCIYNSFYLPSMFFTTLQRFVFLFLPSFSILLLPFSFFKLFLFSFGIFIVSFLIFKYRRKLNCNNFLHDKKFLKRISKAS